MLHTSLFVAANWKQTSFFPVVGLLFVCQFALSSVDYWWNGGRFVHMCESFRWGQASIFFNFLLIPNDEFTNQPCHIQFIKNILSHLFIVFWLSIRPFNQSGPFAPSSTFRSCETSHSCLPFLSLYFFPPLVFYLHNTVGYLVFMCLQAS